MTATLLDALTLLQRGSIALAQVEHAGIRVDVDYLEQTTKSITDQIRGIEESSYKDEVWAAWKKEYRDNANLGSLQQLSEVLFRVLGHPYKGEMTRTGRYKADEETLSKVKLPFVRDYLRMGKLKKARNTYLEGIRRELIDDRIHPSYNLHTVITSRSSSNDPNFQNIPIRDPDIGKLIRRCFIPSPGCVLIEIDYSQIEVRVAACYNHDPNLIRYIEDPTTDMHRDAACDLFLMEPKEVTKEIRHLAKNQFVFPQFYGSVYFQCAPPLWQASKEVRMHLKTKGITRLGRCKQGFDPEPGSFEAHVKEVERKMWEERFPVYTRWKNEWVKKYREQGYLTTLTGFKLEGLFSRNETINYPVQGAAFHCLLWSLICIQKRLSKNRMKTKIVGQIHDSILADVPRDEVQDYLTNAKRIMTVALPRAWEWIVVPLEVEVEVGEKNWYEKRQWVEKDGRWGPKE